MSERIALIETSLGPFGLQAVRTAARLGLRPVLVTADPDRYAVSAQARTVLRDDLADLVVADTTSARAVLAALADHRRELAGVFTLTDYATTVTAEVAAAAGWPGPDPGSAAVARDKSATHRRCREAGVAVADQHLVGSADDVDPLLERLAFPCVVKPRSEAGSIGVRLCRDESELRAAVAALAPGAHDYRGQPRPPGCLVEAYLLGPEVSVELVAGPGGPTVLGVTDKVLGTHPHFVEAGETFPSGLPEETTGAAARCAVAALAAVGHDFGPAHVELRITEDGPTVVEVNARLPGTPITELVSRALDVDLLAEALLLHLGHPDRGPRGWPAPVRAAASRDLLPPGAGQVLRVHGLDLAAASAGVDLVECTARPGDRLSPAEDNTGSLGSVRAVGRTPYEAARRAETALGQISIALAP